MILHVFAHLKSHILYITVNHYANLLHFRFFNLLCVTVPGGHCFSFISVRYAINKKHMLCLSQLMTVNIKSASNVSV